MKEKLNQEEINKIEMLHNKATEEAFGHVTEHLAEFRKTGKRPSEEKVRKALTEGNKKAINYLDKILKIDPKNLKALSFKGFVLQQAGKFGEARYYYDQALEVNPNDYLTLSQKANLLMHQGRYEVAIDYCDKAHKVNPEDPTPLFTKLVCLENLLKGLSTNPEALSKESLEVLSKELNIRRKEYVKTREEFDKVLAKDKGVQEARKQLEELRKEKLRKQGYIVIEKKPTMFGKIKNIFKKENKTK